MPLAVSPDKRACSMPPCVRSRFRVVSLSIDPATGKLPRSWARRRSPTAWPTSTWTRPAAGSSPRRITTTKITGQQHRCPRQGGVGAIQQLIPMEPNAQAIHADATNRYVVSTSLGGDHRRVVEGSTPATGRLTAKRSGRVTNAARSRAPRHFVWDKAQRHVYLAQRRSMPRSTSHAWDAAKRHAEGKLRRTTTLPAGFTGKPWAADLHLSPDGKFLYASNAPRARSPRSAWRPTPACCSRWAPRPPRPRRAGSRSTRRAASSWPPARSRTACRCIPIDPATGALGAPARARGGREPNWVEIVDLP